MPEDDRGQFLARSLSYLQENVRRAGPAASAGYTLIGAILLLGGIGYALDCLARHVALVSVWRAAARHRRRLLRAGQDRLAPMTCGDRGWSACSVVSWLVVAAS